MIIGTLMAMLFSMAFGSVKIPVKESVEILSTKIANGFGHVRTTPLDETNVFILMELRLPRILLAGIVGALLSVVGVMYQAIFRNPMADPYVMGISSGAAFGATIAILFFSTFNILSFSVIGLSAFLGALITSLIVYGLSYKKGKIQTVHLLLAGVVLNSILTAIISLLMIFHRDDLARIYLWTMGSFRAVTWSSLRLAAPVFILGVLGLGCFVQELNGLALGDREAESIGINVERVKKILLLLGAFLTALAVSISGIIGFVGLIVPHFLRIILGPNHKTLLPASIFGGAIFMIVSDTLARTLVENVDIPVGIITACFGGPFFLLLLRRHRRNA
ncbi:MAG: iron chelate uptake ABC transporter family permease subunit [Tissierellia bacterium]|nr:iron chelate uptake ABC transporter family permease subunit [Tissierellia bacterium]